MRITLLSVITLVTFSTAFALGADKTVELKVGDDAPAFEVKDEAGGAWRSSDHYGKKVIVVYFYPADCTGGCTKQAQGYRDDLAQLTEKGVEVVGVSGDSAANHKVFKAKENLNFSLLADTNGKVADAFGVPVTHGAKEAKTVINGQETILKRDVTAKRWTFVIGKDKKILYKNSDVNAAEDSKAILKFLDENKTGG